MAMTNRLGKPILLSQSPSDTYAYKNDLPVMGAPLLNTGPLAKNQSPAGQFFNSKVPGFNDPFTAMNQMGQMSQTAPVGLPAPPPVEWGNIHPNRDTEDPKPGETMPGQNTGLTDGGFHRGGIPGAVQAFKQASAAPGGLTGGIPMPPERPAEFGSQAKPQSTGGQYYIGGDDNSDHNDLIRGGWDTNPMAQNSFSLPFSSASSGTGGDTSGGAGSGVMNFFKGLQGSQKKDDSAVSNLMNVFKFMSGGA